MRHDEVEKIEKANARYLRAAHRVQSAIAAMPDDPGQTPKHLRTGLDMRAADAGGLAKLLIDKGVFTLVEYHEAMAEAAEEEADEHERVLSEKYGMKVKTL